VLLTVKSFLGSAYPDMLAGEDLPDLERIVLLHDLHDPHDHTAAEWAAEMPTMAKNANLQPADAMPILKWLQTQSLKPKTGN